MRRTVLLAGCLALVTACASSTGTGPTPQSTPSGAGTFPPAAAARLAYAALGASETYGIGAVPLTNGYAYRLRDRLRLDGSTFADVGIPGVNLAQAYPIELAAALALRPTVCTVFFGANDLRRHVPLDLFTSELTTLVGALRHAHADVLVIGLPDLTLLPAFRASHIAGLAGVTAQWNRAIATVVQATGAAFLDLSSYSQEIAAHPEDVAADGLHPSNTGHARLATVILGALRADGFAPA